MDSQNNTTVPEEAWYLECFGGLKASRGEQVVERFRTQKTASLLGVLALRGGQTREAICAMLWPDASPEAARASLSTALSALRREMGDEILHTDRQSVALVAGTVRTDVAEFDAAYKRRDWAAAVALFRGPLLPHFYEDPFPAIAGEYKEKARLAFIARLGELERGLPEDARALARRASALFGEEERYFLAMMRASHAVDDIEAALRSYESLLRHARKEGEMASEEARQFAKQLRREKEQRDSVVPDAVPVATPIADGEAASPTPPTLNLPAQWTRFFGREVEREMLSQWLCGPEKLVTISGPGGSGKTRLAVETLQEVAKDWPGRVAFVSLAALTEADLLFSTILDSLALPAAPDLPPLEQLERTLRGTRLLLLLDNFEQLADGGSAHLQQLREALPDATFLVTSRVLLRLPGEREFPVSPLPTPLQGVSFKEASSFASVALFCDRAGLVVDEANTEAVGALCRRLDGIPLALELAAARARMLTPSQIVERLERHPDFLQSRELGLPSRHKTLRATIEWSVDLLSPEVREFFVRLSLFRGGWTLEAAEEICAPGVCEEWETIDFLESLRDHSLILTQETAGGTRYRLLEMLREWSQGQLNRDTRQELQARHCAYYLTMAEGALDPVVLAGRLAEFDAENSNFREALEWALATPEAGTSARLAGALGGFWEMRALFSEGREWSERVLQKVTGQNVDADVRARLLCTGGAMLWYCGDYGRAQRLLEEGLKLYREQGDERGEALALDFLGKLFVVVGRSEDTRTYGEAALALARKHNDIARLLSSLITSAWGCHNTARYDQALLYFREGSQLASAVGERRAVAVCEATIPFSLFLAGRVEEARVACRASLAACDERAGEWANAFLRGTVGITMLLMGDLAGARRLLPGVAYSFLAISTRWEVASLLYECGNLAIELGDYERAALLWGAYEQLAQRIGYVLLPCMSVFHETYKRRLEAAFPTEIRDALLARGRTLSLDDAVALTQALA